jgi:ABC-type sugar transport system ATPase subunit
VTGTEPTAPLILRMEGVSKRYGGVRALENADLAKQVGSTRSSVRTARANRR